MQYSPLGPTGVPVSRICLGTALFGVAPLAADSPALVQRALDLGINFFDTANSYGNQPRFDREGAPAADQRKSAEELLGKALQGHRHEVVLCTKVMEPVGSSPTDGGLSRRHIFQQVERSLKRLGTDYIDVYYAHHPDPRTPIDQTLRAFDDLIRRGMVRYCGLSTYPAWQMMEALWTADRLLLNAPVCHQVHYNLWYRNVEAEIVPACLKFGLSLTVFSPLAGGLFAGVESAQRPSSGTRRWGGRGFSPEQLQAAERLEAVARQWDRPPAELALGWLLSRPAVAAAIIGPETVAELEVSVPAADLQLPEEMLRAVDEAASPARPVR